MTSALISPSFKNIAAGLAGLLLALSCFFAAAPHAQASSPEATYDNGLTGSQVSAIINLLSAFGAGQSVIDNVNNILREQAGTPSVVEEPEDEDEDNDEDVELSASPSSGTAPLSVTFRGNFGSYAYLYLNYGDGSAEYVYGAQGNSFTKTHTYATRGTYTAILSSLCNVDCGSEATKTIVVSAATTSTTPSAGGDSGVGTTPIPAQSGNGDAAGGRDNTTSPSSSYYDSGDIENTSSLLAAAAEIPFVASADSINLLADQLMEVNYALVDVLSSYVALFSIDTVPKAAAAATAPPVPVAGESLVMTLAYLPESLYETASNTTDFMAAVEMAPLYVITDALSEALFKAGLY